MVIEMDADTATQHLKAAKLGEMIQTARLMARRRQQDLALLLEKPQQYVSNLESGKIAEPPAELLLRMARELNADVASWFETIGYVQLAVLARERFTPARPVLKQAEAARNKVRVAVTRSRARD